MITADRSCSGLPQIQSAHTPCSNGKRDIVEPPSYNVSLTQESVNRNARHTGQVPTGDRLTRDGLGPECGGGRHSSSSRTFLNILPNGGTILNDFLLRSSHALVALYITLLSTTSHSVQVSVQLHRGSMSSTLARLVLVIDRAFGSGSEDGFMFVHACRRRQKANYITR